MASELKGVKELLSKLNKLDKRTVARAQGRVLFKTVTPVARQMASQVPVGTKAHRTYHKRTVQPGFTKRSIKTLLGTKFLNKGLLSIVIGVRAEAWYSFLYDNGPYTITKRRQSTNIKAKGHFGNQRRHINIKPYTLRKRPWMKSVFVRNKSNMLTSIKNNLNNIVESIARG